MAKKITTDSLPSSALPPHAQLEFSQSELDLLIEALLRRAAQHIRAQVASSDMVNLWKLSSEIDSYSDLILKLKKARERDTPWVPVSPSSP